MNAFPDRTKCSCPVSSYIMAMAVADHSGQVWFQGFNDVGNTIFGMSADQLIELKVRTKRV